MICKSGATIAGERFYQTFTRRPQAGIVNTDILIIAGSSVTLAIGALLFSSRDRDEARERE
jgi:hypothetical protein